MKLEHLEELLTELELGQKKQLLAIGRRLIPFLTEDDVLQPNDYPELENNPYFRYEEGVLAGIQTVQMAIRASSK